MKNCETMELVRFITEYSDEEKCKTLFKSYRDKVGVVCKKCGSRESRYKLDGEVELDDAFMEVVKERVIDPLTGKREKRKRGRGSQKQAKVMFMSKFVSDSDKATLTGGKKGRFFRFVKMKVMEPLGSKEINKEIEKAVDSKASIISDG